MFYLSFISFRVLRNNMVFYSNSSDYPVISLALSFIMDSDVFSPASVLLLGFISPLLFRTLMARSIFCIAYSEDDPSFVDAS